MQPHLGPSPRFSMHQRLGDPVSPARCNQVLEPVPDGAKLALCSRLGRPFLDSSVIPEAANLPPIALRTRADRGFAG